MDKAPFLEPKILEKRAAIVGPFMAVEEKAPTGAASKFFSDPRRIGRIVGDAGRLAAGRDNAEERLEKFQVDETVFAVASFGPRIGEIDVDLSDGDRGIVASEEEPLSAHDTEIREVLPLDFQPDLPSPLKPFFHGDPMEVRVLASPLGDPLPIAAAVLDDKRLCLRKKGKRLLSMIEVARHIEKLIQQNRTPFGPTKGNS
jgi:hypothetical protein